MTPSLRSWTAVPLCEGTKTGWGALKVLAIVGGLLSVWVLPASAQLDASPTGATVGDTLESGIDPARTLRASPTLHGRLRLGGGARVRSLVGRRSSVVPRFPSRQQFRPRFREVLAGSMVGATIGVPIGVLLMKGAADENAAFDNEVGERDNCCALRRLGIGLLGAAFIGSGAAFGAVQRFEEKRGSIYAGAVIGQLLIGGVGFGIGFAVGSTYDAAVAGGIVAGIPFSALGAAGGAVRAASRIETEDGPGAAQFRGGEWHLGIPTVRMQPSVFEMDRRTIRVTVLTARF